MTLLNWQAKYSVGVASVDYEHQRLIEMINELATEIEGSVYTDAIELFLGELHAAISAHFALEERAMAKADYEELEDHKADHEALLEQIRCMMDEFVADPENGRKLLQESLTNWFGQHFATFDARLHGALGE
ncbi:MAG: hemerythrin family protein [Gammaproteobacteria bacterium]|jgi:hemerythrin|nr:hemerythrin family protein [Gammaproteobacteria bacterium]